MQSLLYFALAIATLGIVYSEDCLTKCEEKADAILAKNYVCGQTRTELEQALQECLSCEESSDLSSRFQQYFVKIEEREIEKDCNGGRFFGCRPSQIFECVLESVSLIPVIAQFQVANVGRLCADISRLTATLNRCINCITGSFVFGNDVQSYVNIVQGLINGGCNCTNHIVSQVQVLTGPGASNDCTVVSASLNLIRSIAIDCSLKLVALPINLPFVDIVEEYINVIVPSSVRICETIVPGPVPAPAPAASVLTPAPVTLTEKQPTRVTTPTPIILNPEQPQGNGGPGTSNQSKAAAAVLNGMGLFATLVFLACVAIVR